MPSRFERIRKAKSIDIQRTEKDRLILKKRMFDELRTDADFITAVRIGRLLNALLFVQSLVLYKYNFKKSTDRRRWTKVFQLNIGYIHEALEVIGSVESKYATKDFYQAARAWSIRLHLSISEGKSCSESFAIPVASIWIRTLR